MNWFVETISPAEDGSRSFQPDRWAGGQEQIPETTALWLQYKVLVDLYKYYLDVAWKASAWYYAITGAILVYFFDSIGSDSAPYLGWLALFLVIVSAAFAYLFIRAVPQVIDMKHWMEHCALQLRLPGRPHVEFGARFMLFNGAMFCAAAIAAALLALTVWNGA